MAFDLATPMDCGVWKDPQNFVFISACRDEVWVYFRCWDKPGVLSRYVGLLHFKSVWFVSQNRYLNDLKGYPNVKRSSFIPGYLIVKRSTLLQSLKALRKSGYSFDWKKYDSRTYAHFIVESHDFYTNIVAGQVEFKRITGSEAKFYLRKWENI